MQKRIWLTVFAMVALSLGRGLDGKPRGDRKDAVLDAMQIELTRSMNELKHSGEMAPYFMSYSIVEIHEVTVRASYGALIESGERRWRTLHVDLRVGDPKLDNSHPLRDEVSYRSSVPASVALENDADAIRATLWLETDRKYKEALQRLMKIRSDRAVKTAEDVPSDDFSLEQPVVLTLECPMLSIDLRGWEARAQRLSALMKTFSHVYLSDAYFTAQRVTKYFISSEGSRIKTSQDFFRVGFDLETRADDGMELRQFEFYDGNRMSSLPDDAKLEANIHELAEKLRRLREAPEVDPYTGPAILSGKAAGVFFHEIFGHRIEGHRQKDETQGQTFARKVGEPILPDFISVVDDPTLSTLAGVELNGYYVVDDEGIRGQRVIVVENGVLRNFLMSRSPFGNFKHSNGHGRAAFGLDPVSRQGNLLVSSAKTVSGPRLREMLIAECQKQNKPFGLVFMEVEGGFTQTGRISPNAFNIRPVLVYRVFVDGRPDEIVRGVDLIGTPLTPFSKILCASDEIGVFNGYCGAESGNVPVSAVSPALLVGEIEVQKREKSSDKPPILPPPIKDKPGVGR